ncbi:hypothetical protein ACQKRQ_21905 [Paraburkholderia sp. NPDC080076]|uniref:hypothetical protein n=1 Tax=Paraburkholderia sp. NPDC080076 TaxID=3390605 RepID=UPI003CFBD0BF
MLIPVIVPCTGVSIPSNDPYRLADPHPADLTDRHWRCQFERAQIDRVEIPAGDLLIK